MPLIHYLLVYDLREQKLVQAEPFNDAAEAANAYAELERKHRGDSRLEIVLIGADSLDTIKLTHGNYFDGEGSAVAELAAARD